MSSPSTSLFDVYLRLRPSSDPRAEPILDNEEAQDGNHAHITTVPPEDYRKRAVERFAFTKVFGEKSNQVDLFNGTGMLSMIDAVLGAEGKAGGDRLVATLGVTGSGKSYSIFGSKSQRGVTQMSLDVLFRSVGSNLANVEISTPELAAVDVAESQLIPAASYLDSLFGESESRAVSRAQTPMLVRTPSSSPFKNLPAFGLYRALLGIKTAGLSPTRCNDNDNVFKNNSIRPVTGLARITRSVAKLRNTHEKDTNLMPNTPSLKRMLPRPSALPTMPNVDDLNVTIDERSEYAIAVSMYEVYNNSIFDLLTGMALSAKHPTREIRRRPLLFKSTEYSLDRKVVCGLRKLVCANLEEALLVLETGLMERKVAGTGSNATSSRGHAFFCIEVSKKSGNRLSTWSGNCLTIADLAGSERARAAKTTGATLVEAGKINESLMHLGHCLQMAIEGSSTATTMEKPGTGGVTIPKPALVSHRSCKLTDILFSNSFNNNAHYHTRGANQRAKAIMIVAADPKGDFNATIQILRYSALAREVAVPRIPSVTSQILSHPSGSTAPSSRTTSATHNNSVEADETIARLQAELALLRTTLEEETQRRVSAETNWALAEERLEELEAEVRADCWDEFEDRLAKEREHWRVAWEDERERGTEHVDAKVAILARGIQIHEDDDSVEGTAWQERAEDLERENGVLRNKVNGLEREKNSMRTPSRKLKPLKTRKWDVDVDEENLSPGVF